MAGRRTNLMLDGFAMGLGTFGSLIVFMLVGMALFIPGFILVIKEHKKPKAEQNMTMKIIGYVLMCLGAVAGLGMGFGTMLGELSQEF